MQPAPCSDAAGHGTVGLVGPNAVLQLVPALRQAGLEGLTRAIFAAGGAAGWLAAPPGAMVEQARVVRLHAALRAALPEGQARAVLAVAGRLTADYLLANRIPRPVQAVLRMLPARVAAFVLVRAIRANAWTFAGTARFAARSGRPSVFELTGNPFCEDVEATAPACVWHGAVFQRLFEVLVARRAHVEETACAAVGGTVCRFEVRF
jgi:divinyl protochlorophyllide a 8-vinyl-reductase